MNPIASWIVEDVPRLRIVDAAIWDQVQNRLDQVRSSQLSTNIRRTEFWKHRRLRHLFTGLIHCGPCGGSLAAIGSDYLACTAARSLAGCSQHKGVKRSLIEEA